MDHLQGCKFQIVTPPQAIVDNASFVTNSIDTKGWDKAVILVTVGALDIAMTALKLQESDIDSSYADIPGADFSASPATLPSATADNTLWAIFVDLKGRKRFLDLVATMGDGSTGGFISAVVILSRGGEWPVTAAGRGLSQNLLV